MMTAKEMMKEAGFQLAFNCPLNDSAVYIGGKETEAPEYEGSVIEIRSKGQQMFSLMTKKEYYLLLLLLL